MVGHSLRIEMNQEQKFEQWAEQLLKQNLGQIIFGNENEGWTAFANYQIKPLKSQYEVKHYGNHVGNFGSKRSAISWCIADYHRQYSLSYRIQTLDSKKQQLVNDIQCRSEVARRSRSAAIKEMIQTKLEPKLAVNHAVSAELEKCISSAKYIQLRGFSNETARTSFS